MRESLRRQIEEDVPREAERVYLLARVETLKNNIGAEVEEYQRLSAKLANLTGEQLSPLDHRLRPVVEASIRPGYVRRRRNERLVIAILVVLLLSAFVPSIPRALLSDGWYQYSESLNSPAEAAGSDLYSSLATGTVTLAATAFGLGIAGLRSRRVLTLWAMRVAIPVSALLLVVSTVALGAGLNQRSRSITEARTAIVAINRPV